MSIASFLSRVVSALAATHFMTATFEVRAWLELLGISGLCGWAACLALGFSLFSPSKAIGVGMLGVAVGGSLWMIAGLPVGPSISNVPLIPSFAGTVAAAFVVELVTEARQAAHELKMLGSRKALPRSWETEGDPTASEPREAPRGVLHREDSAAFPRTGE